MTKNYCLVESPFITYRKQIIIISAIILTIILISYILAPGIQEATKKINSKLPPTSNGFKTIIYLIIVSITIIGILAYLFYRTVIYRRLERCLSVYELPNYPQISMNAPPTKYQNPYFNQEMTHLVQDFYILSAAQASLPCGQYNDLSSKEALQNVLKRGARWLELTVYWTPENNLDKNPKAYLSTGDKQEPTHLIFNPNKLTLEDGLKTIGEEAFKNTNIPLFICLQSNKLLDNGMLPSLFLEKQIANIWAAAFYQNIPLAKNLGLKDSLGNVQMPDAMGKAFLILNWTPSEESLINLTTDVVRPSTELYPTKGIQTIKITPADLPYGNVRGKFVSDTEMIEFNKFHLTRASFTTEPSVNNLTSPKADIANMDTTESYKMGIQIVPQHFTVFPGTKDATLKNFEFFKDGPMKLKPEQLRYIPKPAPPVRKQFEELSYAPQEYKDPRPGFAELQI